MHFLKSHYHNIIQKDFILTDPLISCFSIPEVKKITLAVGGDNTSEKQVLSSLFIIDYISNQRPVVTSQSSGAVVGAKTTLRKSSMFLFLFKFLFQILPNLKSFEGFHISRNINVFTFNIKDVFVFKGLSLMFPFIEDSHSITIQFHFTTKTKSQLSKFGRSFYFVF